MITWDDHEFANDCYRDVANDFDGTMGEEQSTARREHATQAWFEYCPVDLEYYRDDHVIPVGPARWLKSPDL